MKQSRPQNILVINLKYLGDLIVSTAALRAIKCSYPKAKITVLVKDDYKEVLRGNKSIDEIISYDFSIKKQKGLARLKSEFNFLKKLRSYKFDAVVSLQAGDRFVLWSFLCGAKIRVAPIQNNFSFVLTHKADVYEDTISYMEYYLRIAEEFGANRDGEVVDFILDEKYSNWSQTELNKKHISHNCKLICIHPGAGEDSRKWKIDNYDVLVKRILAETNYRVLILLGPQELKHRAVFESIASSDSVIDVSGNIQHLAWVLKNASLLIGMDSGARHLAASLKIPTLTLIPEDKVSTWQFYLESDKHFFISGKRNAQNPANQFLDMIEVDAVFNKVKEIVEL